MLTLEACYAASRFLHIACVMQLFGIALFCGYLAPSSLGASLRRQFTPFTLALALIGLLTALLVMALQAGQMGAGWPDTLRWNIIVAVGKTQFGLVWQWHIIIAAAALILSVAPISIFTRYRLLLWAAAGLLATQALVGHVAMSQGVQGVLQRANQTVHLIASAWWLGCLAPLLASLPRLHLPGRDEAIKALIRFSRSGHLAVALIILSGAVNTWLIVGQWPLSLSHPYQKLLLIKLAIVCVMVVLAVTNRYRVVPAMGRYPARALMLLRLMTLAEILLGCAVLILVSVFATLEP